MKRTFIFQDNDSRARVKAGFIDCLKSLSADKKYKITVEDYREDKTAEQRNFFHTLCEILGNETGYTKGEVKEMCKAELMGTVPVNIGGIEREVVVSSETLKRDEYSQLIETAYRLGAQAGISLPSARWAA